MHDRTVLSTNKDLQRAICDQSLSAQVEGKEWVHYSPLALIWRWGQVSNQFCLITGSERAHC